MNIKYENYSKKICLAKSNLPIKERNFIILFCIYIVFGILDTTQFSNIYLWSILKKSAYIFVFFGLLVSVLTLKKKKFTWFIFSLFLGAVAVAVSINTSEYLGFIIKIEFLLSAIHLSTEEYLKNYILIASSLIVFTLLMYWSGIYYYDSYVGSSRNERLYLGFKYTTFLGNYFIHILIVYFFIKKKDITMKETVFILVLNRLIFLWTDTKAVYYEVLLMVVLLWMLRLKFSYKFFRTKGFKYMLISLMPFLAILIIYLSYNYDSSSEFYVFLNKLLTTRLSLGHEALSKYDLNLFGNDINWITGRLGIERTEKYFYVDSSYLNIALHYGLIILVVLVLGFSKLALDIWNEKRYMSCVAYLILAIHSFSDPQLFDLRYNPLLILMGAHLFKIWAYLKNKKYRNISYKKKKKKKFVILSHMSNLNWCGRKELE
jgi:hypothetical protein